MTPMKFATVGVVINLALGLTLFFGPLGFAGLAIATSVAGWANTILLAVTLHRRGLFEPDVRLLSRLPRILVAAILMAAFLVLAERHAVWLYPWLFNSTLLVLIVVCAAGLVAFAVASVLTGALRLSEVRQALKRS